MRGPVYTRVSDCVRARRCTIEHNGRYRGSTRQRRVQALHTRAPMTTRWPPWQRRVPRALVHRGRPRGWALVACAGERKRPPVMPRCHPLTPPKYHDREGVGRACRFLMPALRDCCCCCCCCGARSYFLSPPQATCAQPRGLNPMHKCARDPALPWGPSGRPLCTSVQRLDPALPRVPRRGPGCNLVQRRARTRSYTLVNKGPPWSVWPDNPSREVHKAGQESAEDQGAPPLGSLPRCRVRSPAGGAGGNAPAGGAGAEPRSPPPVTPTDPPTLQSPQ
jgi:hypothetical protein